MEPLSVLFVVIAAVVGFFAGRWFAPNQQQIKDLENSLAEKEAVHQKYRENVAEHIAGSARKFNQITQQYRELHDHLASGAQELCERRAIPRELSTSHVNILAVESPTSDPKLSSAGKSGEPNIVDVSNPGLSQLSQSNQAILDEYLEPDQTSADIISLDAQRQEASHQEGSNPGPAKDYAIKEKGVINHNSLNRDDVNT